LGVDLRKQFGALDTMLGPGCGNIGGGQREVLVVGEAPLDQRL
jgi:hypothetical protein